MSVEFKLYADFERYNFFRRPEWRWERVMYLADRLPTPARCTKRDDAFVKTCRNFVLRYRETDDPAVREALLWDHPGLFYAYQFYAKRETDPDGVAYLQSRLLAGQDYEAIADAMGIAVPAIDWYEAVFFNVKDKLKHRDWVTKHVLVPAFTKPAPAVDEDGDPLPFKSSAVAHPFLDGSLKMFSYFGGPIMADVMIAGMQAGKPLTSPDQYSEYMDNVWSGAIRRRSAQAALTFEVNKFNVMELFATHTRIMELDRSTDNLESQRTDTERHIKALIDEIPWAAGSDAEERRKGTVVGRLDSMASELRDDELLLLSAGRPVPGLSDNWPERLPEPYVKRDPVLIAKKSDE